MMTGYMETKTKKKKKKEKKEMGSSTTNLVRLQVTTTSTK
jgi:hypothetical protein